MWRITRLHLKNFIFLHSGMDRNEIDLDLSEDPKKINIIVGKMGSGKSSIIGHLQPFSEYGTLDARNKLDAILPEENGLKEITFVHDGNTFEIRHVYTWNQSMQSHGTKSYIKLNGKELNENGNVSSFKELIRIHFGIDQSFLRLLRLGPNVANLINMKSAERKAFIASLLKETEIYMMLSKKLTEDQRNINSMLTVLNNKLVSLSSNREDELKAEAEDLSDDIKKLIKQIDQLRDSISRLRGANQTLMKGLKTDLVTEYNRIARDLEDKKTRLDEVISSLEELPSEGIEELSKSYGEAIARYNSIEEEAMHVQEKLANLQTEINKLTDKILISDNSTQIEILESQAKSIRHDFYESQAILKAYDGTFNYPYEYLINFMTTLQSFQLSIEEMCVNPPEVIKKCYVSDQSIVPWAKKKLGMVTGRQLNLQKLLSNIQFASEYNCPIPLYRPPGCPSEDCPFIQSHPEIIGMENKALYKVQELKSQIDHLDKVIATYQDCITQYPKMTLLRKNWSLIAGVLRKIGVLNEGSLYNILLNLNIRNTWYDHDALIHHIELTKTHEDFEDLKKRAEEIEAELAELKKEDSTEDRKQLEILKDDHAQLIKRLEELQTEKANALSERERLERILSNLGNREALQIEKTRLEGQVEAGKTEIYEFQTRMRQYDDNEREIRALETNMSTLSNDYDARSRRYNTIQTQLQDIKSTNASYQEYLEEAQILRAILSAVSAKEGIPLIMVKMFLEECKEIINDLIADIFDDSLEIVEFNISEDSNEFKIPFMINGNYVQDIEFASQGQQAVISIALSFALCRKSMFDYNILLLDEIDNSIHKTDRERFIIILAKQMKALGTEQAFLITHNDIFQQSGLPVNIILTTDEIVDKMEGQSVIKLF